jgi:hypothetical protein
MASVDRPEILLLSLAFRSFLGESNSSLVDNLYKSAQLKRTKTASGAIQFLEANNPRSILVTYEGLTTTENRAVLDKVVSYVRNGGLVIVGLHFPNFTNMDVLTSSLTRHSAFLGSMVTIAGPTFGSIPPAPFVRVWHQTRSLSRTA